VDTSTSQQYLNYNSFSPSKSSTEDQHNLPCLHELPHVSLKPKSLTLQIQSSIKSIQVSAVTDESTRRTTSWQTCCKQRSMVNAIKLWSEAGRRPAPHHTTTVLRPFFRDHLGEPEENFWTLWCKGRLTEADTPTIRPGATPSGVTSAHLHHPPYFYRPDALPDKQPTASKH